MYIMNVYICASCQSSTTSSNPTPIPRIRYKFSKVHCSVLQCVAECAAVRCSVLQSALHYSVDTATTNVNPIPFPTNTQKFSKVISLLNTFSKLHRSALQCVAVCCRVCCSALQKTSRCCRHSQKSPRCYIDNII